MMINSGCLEIIKGSTILTPISKLIAFGFAFALAACATSLPEARHGRFEFPREHVFVEEPAGKLARRPYRVLGWVKAKATWATLEQDPRNPALCQSYYNKAAGNLWRDAENVGADAVIKVRSVVMLMDGKTEEHATAECSDDGAEGEVLLRGIAIKFKPKSKPKRVSQDTEPLPSVGGD